MQSLFSNALSRAVAKHLDLSATRRETLSWRALLIMQHGTIGLWRLAAYVASAAQTDSVRRRFYRFFQCVRLDSTLAARGALIDTFGDAVRLADYLTPPSPTLAGAPPPTSTWWARFAT